MTALSIISALAFVLSVAAGHHAMNMSGIAEGGQIGSIILLTGLIGLFGSLMSFSFICGMLFAGARP